MMKKLSAGAGFAAVLLLAGCFSQPVRVDPLSGVASAKASTPYRDLSIVLVPSANSESSRKFLRGRLPAHFLPERIFDVMDSIFVKHFGKVMKAADVAEGRKMDADLVAVLDIFTKFDGTPKYEVAAIFLDPAGQPIETVSAKAAAVAFSAWDAGGLLRSVERKIEDQFETNLTTSAKLQAIARAHVPAPSVSAPAPIAAASPEPAYHSDVDIPGYGLKENPDDFAFVVGIEKYSDLPDAQFAQRDAEAVANHLLALGFPRRNVIQLSGPKAGRAGIEKYLEDWLPRNVKPESRVFFYFSGHGAPDATSGQTYLVPWDGDANFLSRTGYPVSRLYAKLQELKAKEIVVALDACFSGAGGRSVIAEGMRPLVTHLKSVPAPEKLVVFTASAADEITGGLKEQGHGMFTYFFLKGLAGAAKGASKGITSRGLYDYLKPKVQDEARRQNREQTPSFQSQADIMLRP